MSDTQHQGNNEIIIVRRRGGGGDGHHGGAWKIAYADFMTAMMAFFLVMWLVNAANEETKASVASYFNPIKLMDERPTDKAIKDQATSASAEAAQTPSEEDGKKKSAGEASEVGQEKNATAGEESDYSEADYFENPFSVLAEIAQETGQQTNISSAGEGGAQMSGPATGADGGEAYRDPFDPDFWTQQIQNFKTEEAPDPDELENMVASGNTGSNIEPGEAGGGTAPEKAENADGGMDPSGATGNEDGEELASPMIPDMADEGDPIKLALAADAAAEEMKTKEALEAAEAKAKSEAMEQDGAALEEMAKKAEMERAQAVADRLSDTLRDAIGGINGKLAEGIEVSPSEGGLLISITDQLNFGMFDVGSAIPQTDLVKAMEAIGALLAQTDGAVAIRGHTDARPFRSAEYDNWRLSTARAHSAYFMLLRGGLDEKRVVQVSGFADRRLKDKDDPFSEKNRRIEILVQAEEG